MGQRMVGFELAKEWMGYTFDSNSAPTENVKAITDHVEKDANGDCWRSRRR